jgi:hypothetical protein
MRIHPQLFSPVLAVSLALAGACTGSDAVDQESGSGSPTGGTSTTSPGDSSGQDPSGGGTATPTGARTYRGVVRTKSGDESSKTCDSGGSCHEDGCCGTDDECGGGGGTDQCDSADLTAHVVVAFDIDVDGTLHECGAGNVDVDGNFDIDIDASVDLALVVAYDDCGNAMGEKIVHCDGDSCSGNLTANIDLEATVEAEVFLHLLSSGCNGDCGDLITLLGDVEAEITADIAASISLDADLDAVIDSCGRSILAGLDLGLDVDAHVCVDGDASVADECKTLGIDLDLCLNVDIDLDATLSAALNAN